MSQMCNLWKIQPGLSSLVLLGVIFSSPAPTRAEGEKEITDLLDRLLGSPSQLVRARLLPIDDITLSQGDG